MGNKKQILRIAESNQIKFHTKIAESALNFAKSSAQIYRKIIPHLKSQALRFWRISQNLMQKIQIKSTAKSALNSAESHQIKSRRISQDKKQITLPF
ncbi:hypothetical protein [Helicobacter sp. 23-1045]